MAKVSLTEAKSLFDEWRKGRKGRSAAPGKLRKIALGIKTAQGIRVATEELGVSSATLWNWGREAKALKLRGPAKPVSTASRGSPERMKRQRKHPLEFIEIPHAARAIPPGLSVTFERMDGVRMKLSGELSLLQVEELAERFLEKRRSP